MRDRHRRVPNPPLEDRGAAKTPRSPFGEVEAKRPRGAAPSVATLRPLWALRILDPDGPWGRGTITGTDFCDLLQRLKGFESMTWGEIVGGGSHFVDVQGCSRRARDRLIELRHDDTDSLFSLRITGRRRLFGIRDANVLSILWWDPEHEVYPSSKKHT